MEKAKAKAETPLPVGVPPLESVSSLYSPSGCDVAADGGDHVGGDCRVYATAGFGVAEVDYPTIQILTFYPGASPDVMATTVTAPLERQCGQLQGLSQMTSTSSAGNSVIVLQFNLSLNIDIAEEEVQSAINAAQSFLPANLPAPPIYSKTNPADAPVLTLAMTSDTIPLSQVEDLVDTRLAPKISQLSGVGLVSISGGQKPAVRIQANPTALSSYGIDLENLRTAVSSASVNAAKGNFDGPHQDYQIDSNDQLVTSADYKQVVVAFRDGAPVMLTDVANIVDGVENTTQAAWIEDTRHQRRRSL